MTNYARVFNATAAKYICIIYQTEIEIRMVLNGSISTD